MTYKRKPKGDRLHFAWLKKKLGVTEESLSRLTAFTWNREPGWPEKFANAYRAAHTPEQRAQVAAERIEHFIATKGAE